MNNTPKRSIRTMFTKRLAPTIIATAVALMSVVLGPANHAFGSETPTTGASIDAATPEDTQKATFLFLSGQKLMKAGRHEDALKQFRGSYGAVASPNARLMIVRMLVALGRDVEAHEEATATLKGAETAATVNDKYLVTASATRDEITEIEKRVGILTVTVVDNTGSAQVFIDGKELPAEKWNVAFAYKPGPVVIKLTAPGDKTVMKAAEVAAGERQTVTVAASGKATTVNPGADDDDDDDDDDDGKPGENLFKRPKIVGATIAGGVAIVAFTTFAIFGSKANDAARVLEGNCQFQTQCSPALREIADDGDTYQTVANTTLVISGIAALAGGALFIWDTIERGDEKPGETPSAYIPEIGVGLGSITVRGKF